ncbi:MAG: divalent-cation tolerance protein CutA [Candidatus Eisenbacteria bacterium]|nr:divalent-cation tolerance protein CutA [Candidatus Eisenbacteria bacterium]
MGLSPQDQDEAVVILTTVGTDADARAIADGLLDLRLAACVSLVPGARSLYRWKGEKFDEAELILLVKTRRALAERVRDVIDRLHPYEVPEFLVLPVLSGSTPYLQWLYESTGIDREVES